jgi:HK97 gp10 family phage protein
MSSVSIKFDADKAFAALDNLSETATKAARPAAQAGAQVFYDEVNSNVARIKKKTGNLASSIYQVYSKDNSDEKRATYHISWNARKAPHGHLVEYGHIMTRKAYIGSDGNWYTSKVLLASPKQVAAKPFIRPAYDSKAQVALEVARDKWIELTKEAL